MTDKPVLLDLFGCEGIGAHGYASVFEVWSVDNAHARLRHNPYAFHLGDWKEGLDRALDTGRVAAIHASPPCQHASAGTRALRARGDDRHPALIEPVRDALQATGLPYVIENVKGAALRNPLVLCGSMFDLIAVDDDGELLRLERHRLFESNVRLDAPRPCEHDQRVSVAGSYGGARRDKYEARFVRHGGYVPSVEVQRELLGAPGWATEQGMYQCIPSSYTAWIASQLLGAVPAVQATELRLF